MLTEVFATGPGGSTGAGSRRSARLAIVGELCAFSSPRIAPTLSRAGDRVSELVLDLREVVFCDAAGVGLLVRLHHRLENRRGRLVLDQISPAVAQLLQLTNVSELFPRPSGVGPSRADRAPSPADPLSFEIINRAGGQVIDLTVHGGASDRDLDVVEQRMLRLIAVRQPTRLNLNLDLDLDLRPTGTAPSNSEFARAEAALAEIGGVLVVTTSGVDT
ncbi:MAG: STAS domain-containing protein [Acidimicrobiales bacterium]